MVKRKAASNAADFDDPRRLYGSMEDVTFGSPVSMAQIEFAALREPVAYRVVVDVAFDMMAKSFQCQRSL